MKGKFPGHCETLVGEILQPKLDWKTILRDMITSCAKNDFRLVPPNLKHLYRGIYLPGTTGEEINIAVAIDTSGSIPDQEIKEFLAEIKGICDAYTEYTIHPTLTYPNPPIAHESPGFHHLIIDTSVKLGR